MDLAREILLEVERNEDLTWSGDIVRPGHSDLEISHDIKVLVDAGWLDAIDVSGMGSPKWLAESLTLEGHKFLEKTRDDTNWNKVKAFVVRTGGPVSIELLKIAVDHIAKGDIH